MFYHCYDSDTGQMKRPYSIVKKTIKTGLEVYEMGKKG